MEILPNYIYCVLLLLLCINLSVLNAHNKVKEVIKFVDHYNEQAEVEHEKVFNILWGYQTDMTQENQDNLAKAQANLADFTNYETRIAEGFTLQGLDPIIQRELRFIRKNATPKSRKLAKMLSRSITSMSQIWGQGGVGIENIFNSIVFHINKNVLEHFCI